MSDPLDVPARNLEAISKLLAFAPFRDWFVPHVEGQIRELVDKMLDARTSDEDTLAAKRDLLAIRKAFGWMEDVKKTSQSAIRRMMQ